jgi:hypothetical protein
VTQARFGWHIPRHIDVAPWGTAAPAEGEPEERESSFHITDPLSAWRVGATSDASLDFVDKTCEKAVRAPSVPPTTARLWSASTTTGLRCSDHIRHDSDLARWATYLPMSALRRMPLRPSQKRWPPGLPRGVAAHADPHPPAARQGLASDGAARVSPLGGNPFPGDGSGSRLCTTSFRLEAVVRHFHSRPSGGGFSWSTQHRCCWSVWTVAGRGLRRG